MFTSFLWLVVAAVAIAFFAFIWSIVRSGAEVNDHDAFEDKGSWGVGGSND